MFGSASMRACSSLATNLSGGGAISVLQVVLGGGCGGTEKAERVTTHARSNGSTCSFTRRSLFTLAFIFSFTFAVTELFLQKGQPQVYAFDVQFVLHLVANLQVLLVIGHGVTELTQFIEMIAEEKKAAGCGLPLLSQTNSGFASA